MFGIGPGELIVIILVALVVLGPEKLPAAARVLGRLTAEMRNLSTEFQRTLHEDAAPAPSQDRDAGTRHGDEDAEPASEPASAPEPDALEAANVTPADFAGLADTDADADAKAHAQHANTDKVAAGVAAAPDRGPMPATSRPGERGRS